MGKRRNSTLSMEQMDGSARDEFMWERHEHSICVHQAHIHERFIRAI